MTSVQMPVSTLEQNGFLEDKENQKTDKQTYMICVDSMSMGITGLIEGIICIHTAPQEGYLLNTLVDTLEKIPDGSNVIFYLKMHGTKTHQDEILYSIAHHFPINTSEITEAINFGRSVKAMSICGILQVCYGSNYKELPDCFDMCISTHQTTRGASPLLINNIVNYITTNRNTHSFYEGFEQELFPIFSKMNTEFLWIFGDVEDKENEIRWNLNKNETNISFANFMRIWKEVLPDEKYTQEKQIQIKNTLVSYGYQLRILIHSIRNVEHLQRILEKLKIL